MAAFVARFANLPRGRTRYFDEGPRDGRVVLVVHGFTQSASTMSGLARGIVDATRFRVIWFDRYGDGLSACPKRKHDLNLFVDQIEKLLAYCGITRDESLAGVIGSSLGAIVASYYAQVRPGRVERLVLFNPGGTTARLGLSYLLKNPLVLAAKLLYLLGRAPGVGEVTVMLSQTVIRCLLYPMQPSVAKSRFSMSKSYAMLLLGLWLGLRAYKSMLVRIPAKLAAVYMITGGLLRHRAVRKIAFEGFGLTKQSLAQWVAAFSKPNYRRSVLSTLRNVSMLDDMTDIYAAVGKHPRPVLLVWGTRDSITPYICSRNLMRVIPRANILEIPGAGHGPFMMKPKFCAATVSSFLQDLGPGKSAHAAKIWMPAPVASSVHG